MNINVNNDSKKELEYIHPEVILLGAYTFFKRDEIDLDSFVMIATASVNPSPSTPPSQDLINRMSQNVQGILRNLVNDGTLTWRNDNGRILFRRVPQNIQ